MIQIVEELGTEKASGEAFGMKVEIIRNAYEDLRKAREEWAALEEKVRRK